VRGRARVRYLRFPSAPRRACEGREELIEPLLRDSPPVILYADGHSGFGHFRPDHHHSASPIVLDRVREQVDEDLRESLFISQRKGLRSAPFLEPQLISGFARHGLDEVHRGPNHFGERHRLDRKRHPARFDPREIQHLVDQAQQVFSPFQDVAGVALLLRRQLLALE
jgi:hypothetical protein